MGKRPAPEDSTKKTKKAKKASESEAGTIESAHTATDPSSQAEPIVAAVADRPSKQVLLSPIATPLADAKAKKRVLKLVKKAAKGKLLSRGVKEVVKLIRKNTKGLCLIAGDVSPLDVIAHMPILCEDKGIPYLFVNSREELGLAAQSKRPTSCMLVLRESPKAALADTELSEFQEAYDEAVKKTRALQPIY